MDGILYGFDTVKIKLMDGIKLSHFLWKINPIYNGKFLRIRSYIKIKVTLKGKKNG